MFVLVKLVGGVVVSCIGPFSVREQARVFATEQKIRSWVIEEMVTPAHFLTPEPVRIAQDASGSPQDRSGALEHPADGL
jgi:hypothetical protein